MTRFGFATLNHSTLHGLPTVWETHLDAAANAGFDALAPDIFWLRSLEAEGVALETLADGLRDRGLACMEIAGLAIGTEELTTAELEENLRYSKVLGAEFMNTRIIEPIDDALVGRLRRAVIALREEGAATEGGTRLALEFSRGSQLTSLAQGRALVDAVGEPGVGVTLDTWHFFLHPEGPDWAALESIPIEQLANVQLSDGVAYGEGEFGDATMNRRRLPGAGDFDLARCARLLAERGFDGAVILEVLSAEERARPIARSAADCHGALAEHFPV